MALDSALKKELSKIISSGQAFQNPLQNNINLSIINVDVIVTNINALTDRLIMPRIDSVEFDDLYSMKDSFTTIINNYQLHTNQLCGVNLDSSKNIYSVLMITQASLDSLPSTASLDNVSKLPITSNGLDVNNKFPSLTDNNPFSKVMGSLKYSSNIFKDIDSILTLIRTFDKKLGSDTYYDDLLLLPELDRKSDILSNLVSIIVVGNTVSVNIQNQINSDNNEYALAQRIVLSQAITENLVYLTTGIHTTELMNTIQTSIFKRKIPKI